MDHFQHRFFAVALLLGLCGNPAHAQTTAFNYQGRLTDGGGLANGVYDLQFRLFDALVSGNQVGTTVVLDDATVTNGIFTVSVDFGAMAFPGADRWLEVGVRPGAGTGAFTALPRQPISATPYAVHSLNAAAADSLSATCINCVSSVQIASLPANSGNYIQNSTTPQAASNFNISGNGTLGGVLTASALASNGLRQELTAYTPNLVNGFLGTGGSGATPGNRAGIGVVGAAIGGGGFNGTLNFPSGGSTSGDKSNRVTDWFGTVGGGYGNRAGNSNVVLDDALSPTVGGGVTNTASGAGATVGGGAANTASGNLGTVGGGTNNIASGEYATVGGGFNNTASGDYSTVGGGNYNAASGNYSFAAGRQANAIHAGAFVWSDTTGTNFSSTATDQFLIHAAGGVGIGTSSPSAQLAVDANLESIYAHSTSGYAIHARSESADAAYFEGSSHFTRWITLDELKTGGSTALCLNSSNQISTCSSSLQYKTNVRTFVGGLDIVRALRPIAFDWKESGAHDLGFAAEEVEQVEPLLAFRNIKGEIEGVKYSQLAAVFVNAFKEQQAQIQQDRASAGRLQGQIDNLRDEIAQQRAVINAQQQQLDALRSLLCQAVIHAPECLSTPSVPEH